MKNECFSTFFSLEHFAPWFFEGKPRRKNEITTNLKI